MLPVHKVWKVLILIFLLALGLRFIYIFQQMNSNPIFYAPIMDEMVHDSWARDIASGGYKGGVYFRPPLYYYLLGVLYYIFGHDLLIPRLIQALLGAASCIILYFIGEKAFNRDVGLIASFMMSVYWILIYYTSEILITMLFVFLILCLILSLLLAYEKKTKSMWLLSGIILGLTAAARMNILFFVPFITLWLYKDKKSRKKAWHSLFWILIGAAIIISPITVRNHLVGGDTVLIASQSGVNFYIGNNQYSDGISAIVPGTRADWWGGYYDTIRIAEKDAGRSLKPSEVSKYWMMQTFEFMLDRPLDAAKLLLKKTYLFWQMRELSNNKAIYFFKDYSSIMRLPFLSFGLLAPLGLFGIALSFKRKGKIRMLLFFILSYMLSVVLFFVNARFRVPVTPFLMLFAAFSLTWLFRKYKKKDYRILGKSALLLIALYLLVNSSVIGFEDNKHFLSSQAHYSLGIYYAKAQMFERAEAEYLESIKIFPNLYYSRYNLGELYYKMGRLAEAERQLKVAISLDPNPPEAHMQLGKIYTRWDLFEQAKREYEIAIRLVPEYMTAHLNLGNLYASQNMLTEAEMEYRRILEIEPNNVHAHNNLGNIYYTKGLMEEAVEHYLMVLVINPDNKITRNNLDVVLQETNMSK